MTLDAEDYAAIACGAFLVVCFAVVMLIRLCRPELLDRNLRKEKKEAEETPEQLSGAPAGNLKLEESAEKVYCFSAETAHGYTYQKECHAERLRSCIVSAQTTRKRERALLDSNLQKTHSIA
ncbi:hypothetical protein BaRGS_00036181, partial [Batillaria attramentaria]